MRLQEGDYFDLVYYLSGMFAVKRMRDIPMDIFQIHYIGSEMITHPGKDETYYTEDFPGKGMQDQVKRIDLDVTCPSRNEKFHVAISWDYTDIDPDTGTGKDFMDFLDRSTIRYF